MKPWKQLTLCLLLNSHWTRTIRRLVNFHIHCVCDPSSEASRCTTWSTWIPDGKMNKKTSSSQISWFPFFSHNKTTGCPTWYWKWVLPFWVLVPLANVGPVPKCFQKRPRETQLLQPQNKFNRFQMQWSALHCQVGLESSATFTTHVPCIAAALCTTSYLTNEQSSFITSCAILSKSVLHHGDVSVWSRQSYHKTLEPYHTNKCDFHQNKLQIWELLTHRIFGVSYLIQPLSFPTYLTAQQEAYHIRPPVVLPRTRVLVPCWRVDPLFSLKQVATKYVYIYIWGWLIVGCFVLILLKRIKAQFCQLIKFEHIHTIYMYVYICTDRFGGFRFGYTVHTYIDVYLCMWGSGSFTILRRINHSQMQNNVYCRILESNCRSIQ